MQKARGPWSLCSQKGLTLGLERMPKTGQEALRGQKQATSLLCLPGRSFRTLSPATLFFLSHSARSWVCGLCIPLSNALDLFTNCPLTLDFPLRSPLRSSPLQSKQLMSPDSVNFHSRGGLMCSPSSALPPVRKPLLLWPDAVSTSATSYSSSPMSSVSPSLLHVLPSSCLSFS